MIEVFPGMYSGGPPDEEGRRDGRSVRRILLDVSRAHECLEAVSLLQRHRWEESQRFIDERSGFGDYISTDSICFRETLTLSQFPDDVLVDAYIAAGGAEDLFAYLRSCIGMKNSCVSE